MLSPIDLLLLAETAARRAGRFLAGVERPSDPRQWTSKGHHDFVTDVDREAERLIGEVLLASDDGARMVGEELSPDGGLDGLVWLVDPLDGTTNFLHGYPAWSVSIAAARDGVLEAGLVFDVPRDRLYRASRDGGAWEGTRRLEVSSIAEPEHALIGTGFPFKHLDRLETYQRQFATVMRSTSGVRRAGSAALDLAYVACGRFDGFWELSLHPWDVAAGLLMIEEAGGTFSDFDGGSVPPDASRVVASNGR
ncbi:MAG TPA: inositol monophosphatase family protein, partial [Gemmatimonadales bacterium]|nr:inositol monophosphatase family protein [Gemmatimonadales bacterium]